MTHIYFKYKYQQGDFYLKEAEFKEFLKKKGKKESVIVRNINGVKQFSNFLKEKRNKDLVNANHEDIEAYVELIEKEKKGSAKGYLYVLMNYYKFTGEKELLKYTARLREERTKQSRRIFPLKEFYQVNQEYVGKLASIGIKDVEQMLDAGKTIKQRENLSKQLNIPESAILELVELSDITRIGNVKSKLACLYHKAGFDTPTKIADYKAEDLYEHFKTYIKNSGWDGMVPNLADLKNNIKSAKTLKEVVEK